jgi:hypothetical protein
LPTTAAVNAIIRKTKNEEDLPQMHQKFFFIFEEEKITLVLFFLSKNLVFISYILIDNFSGFK